MKTLTHITNRSGEQKPFDLTRITTAIRKAGEETQEFDAETAEALAHCVLAQLRLKGEESTTIEAIQDEVERTLMHAGFFTTARAYIVYRETHHRIRQDKVALIDAISSVDEYVNQSDWRVNANANQGYSLGGMILNTSGKITANYWLNKILPEDAAKAHITGAIHIGDLDMLSGYCAGWSLREVLHEGFNGVANKVQSQPPKHFRTALGQMVNFLGTLQNEWAGAQAFSSFDTYLAPFVKTDKLTYKEVKQGIQEFVFNMNVPSRWGNQTVFSNLTFDWTCPEDLAHQPASVGGKLMDFTYGDCAAEMALINRAYIEVMTEGDAQGRLFTFPIPTYNITPDFNWDGENTEILFEMTAKYGLPYFQNFLNSDLKPSDVRSMCCRLQLSVKELLKRGNGLFGSAEKTGSIGVVTINLARIGYTQAGNKEALYTEIDRLLDCAKRALEVKRKVVQHHMDNGFYPFSKRYLGSLKNHFSTIGINGAHEMLRNFFADEETISSEAGKTFALELMEHLRNRMVEFQEETGHLYNLEATPAEGATYRFAKEDQKRFPDILQAGSPEAPYYTNSTQLPVGYTQDAFEALDHQEELQRQYTGGTVLHLYMGERISSAEACKKLIRTVLENYRVPYITITPTFSVCQDHGYLSGKHETCPHCGKTTEVWERVMGYFRPVSQWNKGKKSEHAERAYFQEKHNQPNQKRASIA